MNTCVPSKVRIFSRREKCTTGLAEWNNMFDCVDALVICNNIELNHPC